MLPVYGTTSIVVVRPLPRLNCMVLGWPDLHNRAQPVGLHACAGPELNHEAVLPGWLTLPATELLPEIRG